MRYRLVVAPLAALLLTSCFMIKLTGTGHVNFTLKTWAKFSADTGGVAVASSSAADVPARIKEIFELGVPAGEPVDLVFVVDTTGSMEDDINEVKLDMHAIMAKLTETNPDRQIGIVGYRDLGDEYVSKTFLVLTDDDDAIVRAIDAIKVKGGGDVREHVYAGIDTALREQPWRTSTSQHIVLMGDAPPHDDYRDDPRTYDSVVALATTPPLAVKIHTIGIQCDSECEELIAKGE